MLIISGQKFEFLEREQYNYFQYEWLFAILAFVPYV